MGNEQFKEKLKIAKEKTLKAFRDAKKEPSLEFSDDMRMKVKQIQKNTVEEFKVIGRDPNI